MQLDFANTWSPETGGRFPKPAIWPLLGESVRDDAGHLHPAGYRARTMEVLRFHRSRARVRIVTAPARTAKSFSTANDLVPDAMPDWEFYKGRLCPIPPQPGRNVKLVWVIGPDFKTNKEFDYLWTELVLRRSQHGMPYQLGRHSFNPKQGNMEIELVWNGKSKTGDRVSTLIEGKSASAPETLQGEEIDLWIQSEAAEHAEKVYARYGATRAKSIVLPTTPKLSGSWVKNLIDIGETVAHGPDCDMICSPDCQVLEVGVESFLFTPHANPSYDWERFWQEHAFAEARVDGKSRTAARGHDCFDEGVGCRAMRDPWFAEQFGGRWTFEADRVLPFKWMALHRDDWCHVLDEVPDWLYSARHIVGVDYGYTDGTCVQWWAVGSDNRCLIYREIYETKLDVEVLARKVLETNRLFGERIEFFVGDPQKPEVAKVFQRHGMPVVPMNKGATRDRAAGHARLVNLLSPHPDTGKPRLQVLSEKAGAGYGCPKTIQEWRLLRRKPGATSNEFSAAAIVGDDHAYDVARYISSCLPSQMSRASLLEREMRALRDQSDRVRYHQKSRNVLGGGHSGVIHAA